MPFFYINLSICFVIFKLSGLVIDDQEFTNSPFLLNKNLKKFHLGDSLYSFLIHVYIGWAFSPFTLIGDDVTKPTP